MALAQPPAAVSIPSTAAPYMVWGWKPSVADQYENAQGNDIKTRILTLIRDFQAMKKDNKEEMVNGFMQAGLWGVGLTGLRATWRAMQAASAITEAVEAEAIAEGMEGTLYVRNLYARLEKALEDVDPFKFISFQMRHQGKFFGFL